MSYSPTPLLEINELKTEFLTEEGVVHAVNGISYTVEPGEMVGVVGESGSGKSVSVLSVMSLLPQPPARVSGEVYFKGENLLTKSSEEVRRLRGNQIAMIFQDPMTSLNPMLTIGEQIGEALKEHLGMSAREARKRIVQLLELVGIPMATERVDQYPHQFSGGMRQRVMIAMGLACNPQLLIADEPTTALDVTIQAQIVELVKRLRDEIGMAVIWITHDLGVVAGLAEKVIVMYAGNIVEVAPVRRLYHDPRHPYTLGLLGSLPRLDAQTHESLQSIEGMPPDLIEYPSGCPFADRCVFVMKKCREETPPLLQMGEKHQAACWVDVTEGRGT